MEKSKKKIENNILLLCFIVLVVIILIWGIVLNSEYNKVLEERDFYKKELEQLKNQQKNIELKTGEGSEDNFWNWLLYEAEFGEEETELFLLVLLIILILPIIINAFEKNRIYIALENLLKYCKDNGLSDEDMADEIVLLYNELMRKQMIRPAKNYINSVIWLDSILIKLSMEDISLKSLKEYYGELKRGRNILAARNPFSNCTPYQQRVLRDITELNGNDERLKENIVNRVENEFLRQEKDNKRNIIINIVSIAIGVVGILIPIISYLHGKIHITF